MPTLDSSHIVPFFITLIIGSLFLIFYNVIAPDYTEPVYNFSPFPNILPENDPGCNLYTGRAIWSDTGSFTTRPGQKWTCICLYPDLFGGPGCNVQFTC